VACGEARDAVTIRCFRRSQYSPAPMDHAKHNRLIIGLPDQSAGTKHVGWEPACASTASELVISHVDRGMTGSVQPACRVGAWRTGGEGRRGVVPLPADPEGDCASSKSALLERWSKLRLVTDSPLPRAGRGMSATADVRRLAAARSVVGLACGLRTDLAHR
jgi:hypothetical protein